MAEQLWFGEAEEGAPEVREAPLWPLLMTWLAVGLNIWFGLNADLPGALAGMAAEDFLRHVP